jgi:hypothetical protein
MLVQVKPPGTTSQARKCIFMYKYHIDIAANALAGSRHNATNVVAT